MNTKRITAVMLTLFLVLLLTVTPVLAGIPHFKKGNASGPDATGNLTVSFSVSVEKGHVILVSTGGRSEAVYACKPADGDFNPDPIKEIVTSRFNDSAYFQPKGGSAKGVFTIPPPATSLTCGDGMVVALAMVTYSEVYLDGVVHEVFSKSIPGTFSATYYGYTP